MTMPNFVIIGTAKAGTDALCGYLGQHPQLYVTPTKEPNFFIAEGQAEIPFRGPGDRDVLRRLDMWVSTRERYESLFANANGATAIGEASTWYLYDERAPGQIRHHIPDAKLIAVLRHPAERAYSAFTMLQRDGRETTADFMQALAAEERRIRAGWEPMWHYRRMGFYQAQLARYLSVFRRDQIRIVLHEDLSERPAETVRGLFKFLEVDDRFEPDVTGRLNVSLVPVNGTYHRLVVGASALKTVARTLLPARVRERVRGRLPASTLVKPKPMPEEARAMLVDGFRDDVLGLQVTLDRDLSGWLR